MLAQAEAKRALLGPEVSQRLRFVRGDMAALALNETFDVVVATYYALAHLPAGQLAQHLQGRRRPSGARRPGGVSHAAVAEDGGPAAAARPGGAA